MRDFPLLQCTPQWMRKSALVSSGMVESAMTLFVILASTLTAGIGSVWLAALLSFGVLARYTQHMLSLAAGALLATAFLHLLPEAFESQAGAGDLFITLLTGLIFSFCSTRRSCGITGMSITMNACRSTSMSTPGTHMLTAMHPRRAVGRC